MMSLGRYYQDEKNDRKAFYWYQNAAGKGTHKLASQIFHLKSRWLLGTESNGAHVCSRKDVWHTYSGFPIPNPPKGSMGRHESSKNHALSECRCVTNLLEADSRLPINRTVPREWKSMRELRVYYILTPPCLPIEPLGGLQWVSKTFVDYFKKAEGLKNRHRRQ